MLASAAVEQGVAAAVPFVVGLAAAWALPVAEHGRLALMAGGLSAGLAVHMALVLDPLTARGRVRPGTIGAAALLWLALSSVCGLGALAPPPSNGVVAAAAWGVAGAAGPALLMLARRVAHLRGRPGDALGAVLLAAVLTAGLTATAETAGGFLMALGLGSAAGGAVFVAPAVRLPDRRVLGAALRHHRRLGGWLLVSAGPWVVATQAPLVVLAAVHGEAAAGLLRGLLLLVMPMAHVAAAVGTVVQPRLADAARLRDVRRASLRWGGVIGLLAAPWAVVLMVAPQAVATLALDAAYGPAAASALPLLAVAAVLGALGSGPALALRAARRGRAVAAAATAGAVVGLATAAFLVPAMTVAGAALALLAARGADIAVQLFVLRRPRGTTTREAWA